MSSRKKIRIGDLLVENKMISQTQLDAALADQKKSGRKLGKILVEHTSLSEDAFLGFLAKQLNVPFVELVQYPFDPATSRLIPETLARRFRAIVLKDTGNAVLVGMSDPTNVFAYDELARLLSRPIEVAVVREHELLETIERVYRQTHEPPRLAEQVNDRPAAGGVVQPLTSADGAEAEATRLLQSLFEQALQDQISDIHLEPDAAGLRIRRRRHGVLDEHGIKDKRVAAALVQCLKLMSGLAAGEQRLPQDGAFTFHHAGHSTDVQLSTMPLAAGESVVLRLREHGQRLRKLEQLGMPSHLLERFQHIVSGADGLVIVGGPPGSGKRSTLYSALERRNTPQLKIIAVDDPVEYRLAGVNHVQVNPAIGLGFPPLLRTALRQDPDIVLIGEMRDAETADIGSSAAMTGHLVLSTVHAQDALSIPSRLLEMGASSYLLACALRTTLAQRLLRRVCADCSAPVALDADTRAQLQARGGPAAASASYRQASGCERCNRTGYRGRLGVFELLALDEALSRLLAQSDIAGFVTRARSAPDYQAMGEVALEYARQHLITVAEAMAVAADSAMTRS